MKLYVTILVAVLFVTYFGPSCFAACPSADLTGDCRVDFKDFSKMAEQWLTEGIPTPILYDMTWVSINDPGIGGGHEGFVGEMGKYEITNAQYCQYLNAANVIGQITVFNNDIISVVYATSDTSHSQPYYNLDGIGYTGDGGTNGGAARINYNGSTFTVDSGFEDHPVTFVSWYGATAFCDYYGYRLPTEWEWQAVADYDGSYTYGCGTILNNSVANYFGSTHPDGTTAVGTFGAYGYGIADMAGNVWEWTSTVDGDHRVFRGGCWCNWDTNYCTVSYRGYDDPYYSFYFSVGFRVCR